MHGAGMQAHLKAAGVGHNCPLISSMVKGQICCIGELGLQVNISKMEVRVSSLGGGSIATLPMWQCTVTC